MSRPPSALIRTSGRSWMNTKNSSGSIRASRVAPRSRTRWRKAPVAARPASIHPPNAMTSVVRLTGGSRSYSTLSIGRPLDRGERTTRRRGGSAISGRHPPLPDLTQRREGSTEGAHGSGSRDETHVIDLQISAGPRFDDDRDRVIAVYACDGAGHV